MTDLDFFVILITTICPHDDGPTVHRMPHPFQRVIFVLPVIKQLVQSLCFASTMIAPASGVIILVPVLFVVLDVVLRHSSCTTSQSFLFHETR
jgi:hypothetical protein